MSSEFNSYGVYSSNTTKIQNSREARNCTAGKLQNEYFCGSSLKPQIVKFDSLDMSNDILYRNDSDSGWIHGMAFDRDTNVFYIPSSNMNLPDGVYEIDRFGNLISIHSYNKLQTQTYGGVDLIDENGVIWLWKGYPWEQIFLYPDGSEASRNIDGWSAEGFENINGNIYHIYVNKDGYFDKRKIVNKFSDEKLDNFINVDLQFRAHENPKVVYFNQNNNNFYIYNKINNSWSNPISNQFGNPNTEFMLGKDKEMPLLWFDPEHGQIQILGATQNNEIIGWQYGRKSFFLLDEKKIKFSIEINNTSPSEITSLTVMNNILYGGGNLTWSNIFSYSQDELQVHKEAIPNNEGQIDILFDGEDGFIYGLGYPGAIPFRYNPDLPWNPGNTSLSNPKNCNQISGQTRGLKGFYSLSKPFFLTESDYSSEKITAISRVDLSSCSIKTKSNADYQFPTLIDVIDMEETELLGIGNIENASKLFVFDKENFTVKNSANIYGDTFTLFNSKKFKKSLIGIDSSICIIDKNLELSICKELHHPALKIYELGSFVLIFSLEDLTIVDYNLNIINSYNSSSLGLNKFFPYKSLMNVDIHGHKLYFSNYSSIYKIEFSGIN